MYYLKFHLPFNTALPINFGTDDFKYRVYKNTVSPWGRNSDMPRLHALNALNCENKCLVSVGFGSVGKLFRPSRMAMADAVPA